MRLTLPRRLWRAIPFALAALSSGLLAFGGDAPVLQDASSVWSLTSSGKKAKLSGGTLLLSPENDAWARAIAFGKEPVRFWSQDGVSVAMKVSLDAKSAADGDDVTAWIGFSSKGQGSSIQELDDFAGFCLSLSKKEKELRAGLARKEANGSNASIRGDSYGNVVSYSGAPAKLKTQDAAVELTLTLTDSSISLSIPSLMVSEKRPLGLTKDFWRKAWLVAQCMNCGEGRGSASVEIVSIRLPKDQLSSLRPLDLRPLANMGFKDDVEGDGKGGWTDQGENDLKHISCGLQKLNGIPFDIIDPASNGGKSCLMLYSKNKEFFPKEIGPLAVNGKADSLIFLHSVAWASPKAKAAVYRVNYADGGSIEIPVVCGAQINDWWGMKDVSDQDAVLLMKVKSDRSSTGMVGLYGYRWTNPDPDREISSLTFLSAGGDPVAGVLAVTAVPAGAGKETEDALKAAFERVAEIDYKKDPPDKDLFPDQVFLKAPKRIGDDAFSVSGSYCGGGGGSAVFSQDGYAKLVNDFGGITRFPYGIDVTFYFWPYQAADWHPVLGEKGGRYGTISKWYYKWGNPGITLSYQSVLENYKRLGLKLDLLFNVHAMFDGRDFVYVKTMPEEKMKSRSPMDGGVFSRENLAKIVANNATLVDYVVGNGYADTVAFWEMDNERWDMPGREYAEVVAAHVKMLRSKLPKAKVVVCLGEMGSYSVNPDGVHAIVWSKELLAGLRDLGMAGQIDYFAPHIYPFLDDKADEITRNHLSDYCVRNAYRSLDYMSSLLDAYGFNNAKFYVSEWGTQSDSLGDESRNDLICCMASAIATAKEIMAIYSHPRVECSTWHQFFHASLISKAKEKPISKWGGQTVFIDEGKRFIGTPASEGVKMFVAFARGSALEASGLELPKGVHCLCAVGADGARSYYAVNSTQAAVPFPAKGVSKRLSLFGESPTANSILKYGTYGDKPGEVQELLPREFSDSVLPPYSINVLK